MTSLAAATAVVAAEAAKTAVAAGAAEGAATAAGEVAGVAARAAKPWGQWLRERISRRGTVAAQIDEAAQQRIGKESKIQTALETVFVGQMQQMAQDELDDVRALKDRYLNKGGRGMLVGRSGSAGERHSDLIIGDNIKIESPRGTSPLLAGILAAAAGAAGALFLPKMMDHSEPVPATAPAAAPQANGGAPGPAANIVPPDVKIDDLRLRVKWRVNPETGKIEQQVIEQTN